MNAQHDAQNALALVMGLNALLGLILCFSGYLISKIRIALGALLGFIMAANIGFSVTQSPWAALVAGLIGGVIGALVSTVFYFLGLFLIGALLGGFLGGWLTALVTHSNPQPWIASMSALLGGVVVLLFRKLRIGIVLIVTAMGGAALTIFGILCVAMSGGQGNFSLAEVFSNHGKIFGYLISTGWVVLMISGVIVQYRMLPDSEKLRLKKQMDSSEEIPAPRDIPRVD